MTGSGIPNSFFWQFDYAQTLNGAREVYGQSMNQPFKFKLIELWNRALSRLMIKDRRTDYSAADAQPSYQELSSTLSAIPDLMFELDENGQHWDARVLRPELLVAPAEQLLGHTVRDVMPKKAAEAVMAALAETERNGFSHGTHILLPTPVGERWFEVSIARKEKQSSQECRFIVLSRDITERKLAFLEAEKLAYTDRLTELPNRHALKESLLEQLATPDPEGCHRALLFLDLDDFKQVNDTQGHHVGDELLKQVAKRLSEAVREDDLVVRWGGDEFIVLIGKLSPNRLDAQQDVTKICEEIMDSIRLPYALDNGTYNCCISIGVNLFNEPQSDIETVIQQADTAMYVAKQSPDQDYVFY